MMRAPGVRRILAARLAIVSHERFGPCRTVFDWYACGISDRVEDGRGGKSGGSGRSRGCCQALSRTSPP